MAGQVPDPLHARVAEPYAHEEFAAGAGARRHEGRRWFRRVVGVAPGAMAEGVR